jgi:hypothetical protein
MQIRAATLYDLDALAALEARCFEDDRISRRQFRRLLIRGNAALFVSEQANTLLRPWPVLPTIG